ncbi:MAG: Sau3AI family type II restriction endonuclease [Candidatus Gastranaerophilales bacterium]|nr:Sau3AI family type II restriction endonuclease [Candidatus Gastranaerophilales bacterium]
MQEKSYKTTTDLLTRAKEAIDIPFGSIDSTGRLATGKNKGNVGQMFEECWFGRKVNSRPEADFKELGVELKVTPFIKNKSGKKTAKERLVLNVIDYMAEVKVSFETSHFWAKNQKILLMYYEYLKDLEVKDFKVLSAILFEYPEKDLIIIKQDWQKIVQKIRDGKAHELSEGDTLYLGACRKGAGGDKDLRNQPCCDIKANQRAFCLKQSYMTYVLNNYAFGEKPEETLISDEKTLAQVGFEEYIENKLRPYYGRTQDSLIKEFNLNPKMKQVNERIVAAILGVKGSIAKTEEFIKANIAPKTIRIESNNTVKESMSFPTFKFKEIIEETWEDSYMYNLFSQTKFMFIIFKFDKTGVLIFERVMFWNMPVSDLEEVKKVWEETVKVIKDGIKITTKSGKDYNNLPGMTFNEVSHVRPHGQDKNDCYELPNGKPFTKQCFWLTNKYILKQVLN